MTRVLPSSNSELLFTALAPGPFRSCFGVTNSVASGTSCVGLDDLAGRKDPLRLGFVNVLLQPIFTGLVAGHLHLWATVLHLLRVAVLVDHSLLHPWQFITGQSVASRVCFHC